MPPVLVTESVRPQPRPTRAGLLSEARHVALPEGIVSSGLPAAQATCSQIGLQFDPWQVDLARCILAKAAGGDYAADTVVISIPRQVGKTFLIGALVFADSIINPGTTTVWTAHRFKVSRETFNELRALSLSPAMAPHVDPSAIHTAAGNESITFRNGSRIVFAARERGAIRGFTKVRRLILDEAQILTEAAMSDLAPTMNQATNPQMILMGTPPKPSDASEVFTGLRADALAGTAEGVVYVEFSAEPTSDLDDRAAWLVANPSLHARTPAKAIVRLRKLLSDADFAREALGIWDDNAVGGLISAADWSACEDVKSEIVGAVTLAVDINPDRSQAALAAAGLRPDGMPHVEVVPPRAKDDDRPIDGIEWLAARTIDVYNRQKAAAVVVDPGSPAGSLIPKLEAAGLKVVPISAREYAQACGAMYDLVVSADVRHINQAQLNAAVGGASKRNIGDAWGWSRKHPSVSIAPLVAVTLAVWFAREPYDPMSNIW